MIESFSLGGSVSFYRSMPKRPDVFIRGGYLAFEIKSYHPFKNPALTVADSTSARFFAKDTIGDIQDHFLQEQSKMTAGY